MSRLDELISELCPDGVIHLPLEKVAHYAKDRVSVSDVDADTYVSVENLLQNKMGKTIASSVPTSGNVIGFCKGDVLIGNIRPYLRKIWLADCDGGTNGDVLAIQINDRTQISPEFLYYILSSEAFFNYDNQNSKGAKMPRGDKKAVMNYILPVPPLEVQREIVRILDNFTELTARKQQYEYYFHKIINMYDSPIIQLGDIGQVKMCKRIMKAQTSSEGDIPFYKIGTFGKEADAYMSRELFEEYVGKYSYPAKGDILISCSGTIGRTVVFNGEPAYFQDSNIVWLEHDGTKVSNEYLRFAYMTNPWIVSTGGTISRLYNDGILKAEIPLPSLEEQKNIVALLSRFDAICNDISSGLPAEIEARQKQYEYYRDKLLTFKQLA